jgi:hypothetical protein
MLKRGVELAAVRERVEPLAKGLELRARLGASPPAAPVRSVDTGPAAT